MSPAARERHDQSEDPQREPLKSYRRILHEEIVLAHSEMERSGAAIAASGLLAGLGVCLSVFLIAALNGAGGGDLSELAYRFFVGNAYAAGFLIVIFARADLFTEYTTITVLPVLMRRSSVRALGRLWAIVYTANLAGALAGAGFLVLLGRGHGAFSPAAFDPVATEIATGSTGGILLGALFAGWLMGLLSWLIVAARETVSQLIFVWVIGASIGFGQLPHSITGSAEVAAAAIAGAGIGAGTVLRFIALSTIGNAVGSIVFAVLIYALARQPSSSATPSGSAT